MPTLSKLLRLSSRKLLLPTIWRGWKAKRTRLVASRSLKMNCKRSTLPPICGQAKTFTKPCVPLDNCGHDLGGQNIADIAAKVAKLDVTIAKLFSTPSDPVRTSAQERDIDGLEADRSLSLRALGLRANVRRSNRH
jgi:hypothetical protein